jgi:GT2 family glycosyltransferase/glycosyltransferase involved in cell wall biosynthesis
LTPSAKVAFVSGTEELNERLIARMSAEFPELPLYVVSEFAPPAGARVAGWIRYHIRHSLFENLARCRAALAGKRIRLAGVVLVPRVPYRRMRLMALLLSPAGFIAYNENLDCFMLRPRSARAIVQHLAWRVRNWVRFETHPGGTLYTILWRTAHPREWALPLLYVSGLLAGAATALLKRLLPRRPEPIPVPEGEPGISVVIPSRNGRHLLECGLPGVVSGLAGFQSEVIVVDNGSGDRTSEWLAAEYPDVRVISSAGPLSFARAVNRGIAAARFSRICLLNNDMVVEPGFFGALLAPFDSVPDLFCSTAQILFPPGVRREETGKAVMPSLGPRDFPVSCIEPLPGEDGTCVLYGSGGCSLYDTAKLRRLGGAGEMYEPAYCEDLDLGYRAWVRGWPTVFASAARVEHRHRATTSRYYSERELERVLEVNYLRFLAHAVGDAQVFQRLWRAAMRRLRLNNSRAALRFASWAPLLIGRAPLVGAEQGREGFPLPESAVLSLCSGDVAVFPGCASLHPVTVLVVCPYVPFPLSHGGAVRIYNLMRRASAHFRLVLVAFSGRLETPPRELSGICAEIVLVRRAGSHLLPRSARPDEVEQHDSPAFRAALAQTVRKHRPAIAQLEMTQMAQYAADCAGSATVLVEHDITLDLYEQLLADREDWDVRRQYERWKRFETGAWRSVDRVVTMSEKDRRAVAGGRAVTIPNGVDLDRFRPSEAQPEPGRILFIGSFAHLPNLMALDFFLREVWPLLGTGAAILHVIAGQRHESYLKHYADSVAPPLDTPGVELEGFVADPRPAYERASVVIAPLVASAGTNIKVLEAMAMAKVVVATPAGINGLDLGEGDGVLVTPTALEMAGAIGLLLANPGRRRELERSARAAAEARYGWDSIAALQRELYESLRPTMA